MNSFLTDVAIGFVIGFSVTGLIVILTFNYDKFFGNE